MAQAQTSILLNALRGKAGSVVFVNTRTGVSVRPRITPRNPQTPLQTQTRNAMMKASRLFSTFDPQTAQAWKNYARTLNTFDPDSGQQKCPSGQNVFAGLCCKMWQMDSTADVPLSPPASPFFGDGITVSALGQSGGVTFTASGVNSANVVTELLLQPLRSGAVSPQKRAYRSAGFVHFGGSRRVETVLVAGLWVAVAVRYVNSLTGQQSPLLELGVVQMGQNAGTAPETPPPPATKTPEHNPHDTVQTPERSAKNAGQTPERTPPQRDAAGYNCAMNRFSRFFFALLLLATFGPRAHAAPDTWHFIAYGDTRSHPEDHAAVIRAIVRMHPEFVLQSGDLVAAGGNPKQWTQFDGIVSPLRAAHIAYYPARGNHDVGPYYIREIKEPYDSGTGYYYAFTRHGARFLMVDSLDPQGFAPGTAQGKWLLQELQKTHKSGALCFVCFHEGPYSVGPHGPTPEAARYLHPLFIQYKPTAVFCGHDHLYYHTVRDGVSYFVTGGGGAPLYDPVHREITRTGDVYCSTHHVIQCDVVGKKVTLTAVSLDGSDIAHTPALAYHVVDNAGRARGEPVRPQKGGTPFDRVVLGK